VPDSTKTASACLIHYRFLAIRQLEMGFGRMQVEDVAVARLAAASVAGHAILSPGPVDSGTVGTGDRATRRSGAVGGLHTPARSIEMVSCADMSVVVVPWDWKIFCFPECD